ncbi:unnamed protein product, partial [Tetraodon nigroviridis]
VNIGHEFQAELPPCTPTGDGAADEESPREQLLWKPRQDLEDSGNLKDQGDGLKINSEGSKCKSTAPATTVCYLQWRSCCPCVVPAVCQEGAVTRSWLCTACTTVRETQWPPWRCCCSHTRHQQETTTTPVAIFGPMLKRVSSPQLWELTGKSFRSYGKRMFYKIKSRNAHMKIHRQPQDDWADRRLQHQLVPQRSGANLHPTQVPFRNIPPSCLPGRPRNTDTVLNLLTDGNAPSNTSVLDPSAMATCSNVASSSHVSTVTTQREHVNRLPFYPSWGSFGPQSGAFFCNTEGKDEVGAGALGAKEPIKWQ